MRKCSLFVMLNPSHADSNAADKTIINIEEITRRNNCNAFAIVNLFSYRTAKPKELESKIRDMDDSEKYEFNKINKDEYLEKYLTGDIVLAWGTHAKRICRIYDQFYYDSVLESLRGKELYTYADYLNKDGSPKHPGPLSYNKIALEHKCSLKEIRITDNKTIKLI